MMSSLFFFFNDTATTEIYTLSLHDALPILADSPVAMAACYYDKFAEWTDSGGEPEQVLTYDEMLDAITLYWVTNTGASSRSEEHTSELQSHSDLVCRLLLEKKNKAGTSGCP